MHKVLEIDFLDRSHVNSARNASVYWIGLLIEMKIIEMLLHNRMMTIKFYESHNNLWTFKLGNPQ